MIDCGQRELNLMTQGRTAPNHQIVSLQTSESLTESPEPPTPIPMAAISSFGGTFECKSTRKDPKVESGNQDPQVAEDGRTRRRDRDYESASRKRGRRTNESSSSTSTTTADDASSVYTEQE